MRYSLYKRILNLIIPIKMQLNFKKIGEGKPFIILHGLFGMGDNLQSFSKSLTTHGYMVYLVDLRNHGQSPHDDLFNYNVMSDDVAELIESEKLFKPIVFGHSLGGKVAMQLAISHPHVASTIIVVDIAPHSYPVHHQKIIEALKSIDLQHTKSRGEAEKELAVQLKDNSTRQFLLKNLYWKNKDELAWRFNLTAIDIQIEEVGKPTESDFPVSLPVLFIKGEQSDYIDSSKFDEFKKTFTNARLVTIPNAGHWIHADNPNDLHKAILEFLNDKSEN